MLNRHGGAFQCRLHGTACVMFAHALLRRRIDGRLTLAAARLLPRPARF